MSVLWGSSFSDIVMLDVDDMYSQSIRNGGIEDKAERIGFNFELGNCLIVLEERGDCLDWTSVNYYLIYDRLTEWPEVRRIIRMLARKGSIDKKLRNLDRVDFTTRICRKTPDGFVPFPIGYITCPYRIDSQGGGIRKWLSAWKISKNIR